MAAVSVPEAKPRTKHKNAATTGLFENEPQSAELFVFVRTEVALLSEQFAEHFR